MDSVRTCIGCRKAISKTSLHRFRRSASGDVAYDPSGKAPGRGAYVCSIECLEKATVNGRLAASLRTGIDREASNSLLENLRAAIGC